MTTLITGITGQDGSILARKLLKTGEEVHGTIRRNSDGNRNHWRIADIKDKLHLHYADLTDHASIYNLVQAVKPDKVYNLAAQSQVGISYANPTYTMQATGIGACTLMDAVTTIVPEAWFYQASSSEMWGVTDTPLMDENTSLSPISPYACAKVLAHNYALMLRGQGFKMAVGILNNHESEWRGDTFVTSKIVKAAANAESVTLGYLGAIRDWGYAPEYVDGMIMMMEHSEPDTFVLGTGEGHTVEEFLQAAYAHAGLDFREFLGFNKKFMRPTEAGPLIGDYSKAKRVLGWEPKTKFDDLVKLLVNKAKERNE